MSSPRSSKALKGIRKTDGDVGAKGNNNRNQT